MIKEAQIHHAGMLTPKHAHGCSTGFADDISIWITGPSLEENAIRLASVATAVLEWVQRMIVKGERDNEYSEYGIFSEFTLSKCRHVMLFLYVALRVSSASGCFLGYIKHEHAEAIARTDTGGPISATWVEARRVTRWRNGVIDVSF